MRPSTGRLGSAVSLLLKEMMTAADKVAVYPLEKVLFFTTSPGSCQVVRALLGRELQWLHHWRYLRPKRLLTRVNA